MNRYENRFPTGSVVYYFRKYGAKWTITYGIAYEHYHDSLVIENYTLRETRFVDGVPYNEWEPEKTRKKLPKGWTYNTSLFNLTEESLTGGYGKYNVTKPDDIHAAIRDGLLIRCSEKDWSYPYEDITANGYRIVRCHDSGRRTPNFSTVVYSECFASYEEAEKAKKAHDDELLRQANLSDYEWSLEQIDKTLNRALALHYITEEQKVSIREQLLKEDVENIETRLSEGKVQWRLWKKKKWISIE